MGGKLYRNITGWWWQGPCWASERAPGVPTWFLWVLRGTSLQAIQGCPGFMGDSGEGRVPCSFFLLPSLLGKFAISSPGTKAQTFSLLKVSCDSGEFILSSLPVTWNWPPANETLRNLLLRGPIWLWVAEGVIEIQQRVELVPLLPLGPSPTTVSQGSDQHYPAPGNT